MLSKSRHKRGHSRRVGIEPFGIHGQYRRAFVDIGGGKTEISAVTNHGIATGCSVNIAGDAFNNAIIDSLYMNYGVKVGEFTIENLKNPLFPSISTMRVVMR